jgi:RNA-directed DNA polymerase
VNESKSRVCRTEAVVFLGFTFRGANCVGPMTPSPTSSTASGNSPGALGVSRAYRLERLARYIRGWMNYFGISDYYRPIPELDHWLRRRIRMCYWKQWRRVRTKVRHLLALGTGKRQAILTALSSKSYWHLSRTLATQSGMTNAWLQSQGLISVRDLWLKAHGYA